MSRPVIERLMEKVEFADNGCWVFTGGLAANGYGMISAGSRTGRRRTPRTHRVTYEHFVGPVPDGLDLDHLCRNRACCNPAHLEPVDRKTNVARGVKKTLQTECKNGHPLSGDNLIATPKQRKCRTCRRAANRRYERKKGQAA